ncbi:MAG: hypothetical protein J6W64_06650 [Bacilli bacterium]|nr:hypothetical protein [Bacilli bacterium]
MRRFLYILFIILTVFLLGCNKKEDSKLEIKGKDTIEIGFSSEYSVFYDGALVDSSDLYWIIDNTEAVKRKGSTLIGIEAGEVNLKAVLKSDGSVYASKDIKVIDSIVKSISLRGQKTEAIVGEQFIVTIITDPFEAIDEVAPIWTSSDDSIVFVDPAGSTAIINPLKEGTATVSIECSSATASFTVSVSKPITEIEMYNDNEMSLGSTINLSFNIKNPVIEAVTDNIELNDDYLYAKSAGLARIKVSQKNNKNLASQVFEINVVNDNKVTPPITEEEQTTINNYLNRMTLTDKLGQMFILNLDFQQSGWRRVNYTFERDDKGLYYILNNDVTSKVYTSALLNNYPFGSYQFTYNVASTEDSVSSIVLGMQNYMLSKKLPGGLIILPQSDEGYEGFNSYLNNLTLGTINDFSTLKEYSKVMGDDLARAGINTYISNVYSSNGVDAYKFSNLTDKQSIYSSVYYNTLKKENIGLAPILSNDNYSEDYIYIKRAINDGVSIISVEENKTSKKSFGSITEKLRTSGYNGLIIDSWDHFDESRSYQYSDSRWDVDYSFYYDMDYYVNAINEGADLFNITIYLESASDRWNYRSEARNEEAFNFLSELESKVTNKEISIDTINASVTRILLYKLRNNLLEGTYPVDDYELSTENSEYITSIDSGFNTIAIEGTFKAVNKKKNVVVLFESDDIAQLLNSSSYTDRGYKNLKKYQMTKDSIDIASDDSVVSKLDEDDQVILMFSTGDDSVWYHYTATATDNEGNPYEYLEYDSVLKTELVEYILSKTDKLTIVYMGSQEQGTYTKEYNLLTLYMNYEADTFKPLFEVLEKGNAKGVLLDQK